MLKKKNCEFTLYHIVKSETSCLVICEERKKTNKPQQMLEM